MNTPKQYTIEDTPCYPCRYKLVAVGYRPDNATCNYFRTVEEARAEIKRRVCVEEAKP